MKFISFTIFIFFKLVEHFFLQFIYLLGGSPLIEYVNLDKIDSIGFLVFLTAFLFAISLERVIFVIFFVGSNLFKKTFFQLLFKAMCKYVSKDNI